MLIAYITVSALILQVFIECMKSALDVLNCLAMTGNTNPKIEEAAAI